MRWPLAFVITSSVLSGLLIVLTAFNLIAANQNRSYSCDATVVALDSIANIARAGIRPVPPGLPGGTPQGLQEAFRSQMEATRKENERRMAVIAQVREAHIRLVQSSFCP